MSGRPAGGRPRLVAGVAILVSAAAVSACGSPAGGVTTAVPSSSPAKPSFSPAKPSSSATPSPTAGKLVSGRIEGTEVAFLLPEGTSWTPDGDRRSSAGARIRRWRFRPAATSPTCVVTVGEQTNYSGSFPAAALTAFAATRESGVETVRNEPIAPPPVGTLAAIRQEEAFVSVVPGAGTTRSHLFARQELTVRHTLVAVYAASPDDVAGACRPDQVVESLEVLPAPTGPSSATAPFSMTTPASPSSTGGTP